MSLMNMLWLCFLMITAIANDRPLIYYEAEGGIYSFDLETNTVDIITPNISFFTARFSNSGHLFAYTNAEGVWITPIDHWNPQKVISDLPTESFSLEWLPDDSRLIIKLAFWHDAMSSEQLLSYSLIHEEAEPWVWKNCTQIVQHNLTGDLGLVCTAYEELSTQAIAPIVWQWSDHIIDYDEANHTILLEESPLRYDWGVSEQGQNLVYLSQNNNYEIWNDEPSKKLNSLWNGEIAFEISHQYPDIRSWLSVSNDRSLIAYSGFCERPLPYCMQIADNETGDVKWTSSDMMRTDSIIDVAWYPDDRYIAVLGRSRDWQETIYIFDVQTGEIVTHDIENTNGRIAIK